MSFLESFFKIEQQGSTIRKEVIAGVSTFLTMAYIMVANPAILSDAGMDFSSVFVATIIAAAVGTLIMGLWANWPVALAPGMGLNAFFAYGVVLGSDLTWPEALATVLISGIAFAILSLVGVRTWLTNNIPLSLRQAISVGIGFFLAFIGLRNAGIIVDNPATLVSLGDIHSPAIWLAALGLILMVTLEYLRVLGGVIISILAVSALGWIFGLHEFQGIVGAVPSIEPTLLQIDISRIAEPLFISTAFAFLFVDFLDTVGTLTSVATVAGKTDETGKIKNIGGAVMSDSLSTVLGSMLGTSTVTSYIESGVGIREGGRTGLTAVVISVLFLLCLFFSPLALSIPSFATAPALIFVATFFVSGMAKIDWQNLTESLPALLIMLVMPLSYSIAGGLAAGFAAYAVLKLCTGRRHELNPATITLAALSLLYLLLGHS
ncbi:MAG: NCS2 family permease [Pseudomonadota bacterium]